MRLILATLVAVLVVNVGPSHAYKLGGKRWPTRTITYSVETPQYKQQIKAAVAAWNGSGVKLRFKATSKSRAMVRIVYRNATGAAGDATLGWVPRTAVTERTLGGAPVEGNAPCGLRVGRDTVRCRRGPLVRLDKVDPDKRDDPLERHQMAVTVSHELGHVLGLGHEKRACATMGTSGPTRCPKPPAAWQLRCRLLQADDVRGAIRRYGGRARALGPEFCDAAPAPTPPIGLTARFDAADYAVVISFRNITSTTLYDTPIRGQLGACPTEPVDVDFGPEKPGAARTVSVHPKSTTGGPYCVAVWSRDTFGRLSTPAAVWIDLPPAG